MSFTFVSSCYHVHVTSNCLKHGFLLHPSTSIFMSPMRCITSMSYSFSITLQVFLIVLILSTTSTVDGSSHKQKIITIQVAMEMKYCPHGHQTFSFIQSINCDSTLLLECIKYIITNCLPSLFICINTTPMHKLFQLICN